MGCSHVCLVPALADLCAKTLNFVMIPDLQPRRGDRLVARGAALDSLFVALKFKFFTAPEGRPLISCRQIETVAPPGLQKT